MNYAPLFRIKMVHDFKIDQRCLDLSIQPTDKTEKAIKNLRLILRRFPDGGLLMFPRTPIENGGTSESFRVAFPPEGAKELVFELRMQNTAFGTYTDLNGIVEWENQKKKKLADNPKRTEKEQADYLRLLSARPLYENSSSDLELKLTAVDGQNDISAKWRVYAQIRVKTKSDWWSIKEKVAERVFTLKFEGRKGIWRYYFLSGKKMNQEEGQNAISNGSVEFPGGYKVPASTFDPNPDDPFELKLFEQFGGSRSIFRACSQQEIKLSEDGNDFPKWRGDDGNRTMELPSMEPGDRFCKIVHLI